MGTTVSKSKVYEITGKEELMGKVSKFKCFNETNSCKKKQHRMVIIQIVSVKPITCSSCLCEIAPLGRKLNLQEGDVGDHVCNGNCAERNAAAHYFLLNLVNHLLHI